MPRQVTLPPVDATPEEIVEALFNYNPDNKDPQIPDADDDSDEWAEAG